MFNIFELFWSRNSPSTILFSILWPTHPLPRIVLNIVFELCHINKVRFVINKIPCSSINNLEFDIHLFVSDVFQRFVSAQEKLSKNDLLFRSYENIFAKISSSETEELFKKHIVQHLENAKKRNEKSWRHDRFYKKYAEQSKTQKNKNSNLINLASWLRCTKERTFRLINRFY